MKKVELSKKMTMSLCIQQKDSVVNVIKDICEEKHATLNILDTNDIEIKEVNARGNVFSFKNGTYSTKMVGEHQVIMHL